MTDATLVVPIALDALSLNAALLDRDGLRWWQYDYRATTLEPPAKGDNIGGAKPGVLLHWALPDGLRQGVAGPDGVSFPLVPNRWLVARLAGAHTAAWVIESDCPHTAEADRAGVDIAWMAPYLVEPGLWAQSTDAWRNQATTTTPSIGVPFALADWRERDPHCRFLTALGPGNHTFPIYTPHNWGVFSYLDTLSDVPAGPVSYVVAGWYADPAADVLAGWQDEDGFAALLDQLGWADAGAPARRSLYHGLALSVAWDPDGEQPPGADADPLTALRSNPKLRVALGNTTIDAFTALVAGNAGVGAGGERILRAFQYDLLPVLDQVNGDALLDRQVRQAWFGSSHAGYRWTVAAADGQDPSAATPTEAESAWLTQLNRDQAELDAALQTLYDLQWRFHAMWWKAQRWDDDSFPVAPVAGKTKQDLLDQIDPDVAGSLGAQVVAQLGTVRTLAAKVPQPDATVADPEDALLAGIAAFARAGGLDPARVLKAAEAPRHWRANDPVVVMSGVQPPAESGPQQTLATRLTSGLVTRLSVDGATVTAADAGALPSSPQLPDGVDVLVQEWFLVDPANAAAIASAIGKPVADVTAAMRSRAAPAYTQPLPALGLDDWTQPWSPMFFEWSVAYTALPDSWTFDGEDYHAKPGATGTPQTVGGISLLSPHAQFILGERLADFLADFGPDPELQALHDAVFGAGNAPLPVLAQALTGFNDQLATRDQRAFRRPGPGDAVGASSVAALAGFADAAAPSTLPSRYCDAVATVPYIENRITPPFHAIRQGQMWFTYAALYDKFGRVLTVVADRPGESGLHDYENFPVVLDAALVPESKVNAAVQSVAELPPRILQPARLDFDLLDSHQPARVQGRDADVNPICAWLIPNHLDGSLLLYAPDGSALGDYRLAAGTTGVRTGVWSPPPHGTVSTFEELAAAAPQLGAMLASSALAQENAFGALLDVIDTTLWTTDPLGARRDQSLSVLVGRPLALVSARLAISLAGPAWTDTSWAATFSPAAPTFPSFALRLGDLATREDGVIGYFAGDDYSRFNSVAAPQTEGAQTYVAPIGGSNYLSLVPGGAAQTVTLLTDPRASMHATTGVLPVTEAALPADLVQRALAALELTFRVEPVLTPIQDSPVVAGATPAYPRSITLPVPAESGGSWSFWTREAGATAYGLLPATHNAGFQGIPLRLCDGRLQLIADVESEG